MYKIEKGVFIIQETIQEMFKGEKKMKKNIKKFLNSKFVECIKLFFYGIYDIVDKLIPVLCIYVSITAFFEIPKYSGYFACVLFVLAIIGVFAFFYNTYKIGEQYFSICEKDKNKKNKVEKTNKKTTSKKENNTKLKETIDSETEKN